MIEAPMYRQAIPQAEYDASWEQARAADLHAELVALHATLRALRGDYADGPPLWRAARRDLAQRAIAALPTREPPRPWWRTSLLAVATVVAGAGFPTVVVILTWPR